jgi:hypothetical protein
MRCICACISPHTVPVFFRLVNMPYQRLVDLASNTMLALSVMGHVRFPTRGIANLLLFLRPRVREQRKERPEESYYVWGKLRTRRTITMVQPSFYQKICAGHIWHQVWNRIFATIEEEEPQRMEATVVVMAHEEGFQNSYVSETENSEADDLKWRIAAIELEPVMNDICVAN